MLSPIGTAFSYTLSEKRECKRTAVIQSDAIIQPYSDIVFVGQKIKYGFHQRRKHMRKRKSFMSSENERDSSASTRKGKSLIPVLVLILASRPFSR